MSLIFRAGVDPIRYTQLQALSNCQTIATSPAGTTTSATFANTPGSTSVSFVKYDDLSKIRIDLHTTLYATSSAPTAAQLGVLVNTVDYPAAFINFNVLNVHKQASGVIYISGVSAGAYTAQGRWLRFSGTGTLKMDANDYFSLAVSECRE